MRVIPRSVMVGFVNALATPNLIPPDASTKAVLDAVTEKYRRHGGKVDLIGLNSASVQMREKLAWKINAGH